MGCRCLLLSVYQTIEVRRMRRASSPGKRECRRPRRLCDGRERFFDYHRGAEVLVWFAARVALERRGEIAA